MSGLAFHLCGDDVWGYVFHSLNTLTFNATSQQYNIIMQAPEAATIAAVGFNFNARTGAPGDITFKITNVDAATGNPGTTVYATDTIASNNAQITYGGASGALSWIEFTTPFAVTKGQIICCTMITATSTWDASNFITINYQLNNSSEANGNRQAFPYASRGSARQDGIIGGMRSTTKAYGYPIKHIAVNNYLFTTDTVGTRFTVPANLGGSVRLSGIRFRATLNGGTTTNVRVASLVGTTATQLLDVPFDADFKNASSGGYTFTYLFDSPINLTAGTQYIIGLNAPGAQMQLGVIQFSNAASWGEDSTALTGTTFGTVKSGIYTSGGVWADSISDLFLIYPIFDLVNAASGSGGLATEPRLKLNAGLN